MGLRSKLKALLDLKGLKVSTLADDLNLNRNTLYSLIQRDSDKMDMGTLSRIADYLGVSLDYFFMSRSSDLPLYSTEEDQLIQAYRKLPLEGQRFIRQAVHISTAAYADAAASSRTCVSDTSDDDTEILARAAHRATRTVDELNEPDL